MNPSIQTLPRPAVAHEPGLPVLPSLAAAGVPDRRRLSSQALLGNEREVEIEHGGQLYRLRLTSLGKLILTKYATGLRLRPLATRTPSMCDKPNVFSRLLGEEPTVAGTLPTPAPIGDSPQPLARGSRRRRLWELPSQALCPVIGVCLPMPVLRRRIDKSLGGSTVASDYDLHCGAINECGSRSAVAETLQRELDQRYAIALRQSTQLKSTEALTRWWAAAQLSSDVAGSLWATLTHARCDASLQEQVLRDIHMLQHQVGAANRADLQRLEALLDENQILGRELAQAQSRSSRVLAERAGQIERLPSEQLRLRGELLGRDTAMAGLREDLQRLEAAVPGLRNRQEQADQIRLQQGRIHELERALLTAQQQIERERRRVEEARQMLDLARAPQSAPEPDLALPELSERAVLCVGGRQAVVPIYRQLIERTGGRFLHHDGGEEDAVTKLDASLAAADLVICQTGCISHDAYWRVKDHCKRHGKKCLYLDSPSASGLRRALGSLGSAPQVEVGVLQQGHQD